MYEDLNEIASLRFNRDLESISAHTRERVREMQNEYAAQMNSSGVRSGPQEMAIGRAQIEGSERLVHALYEIWVDLVKRRNGYISRSDVDFIAKKLEGFAQTQRGHLHHAFATQRGGAVVNLLSEEAGRRLQATTANARRDLAIMEREHELLQSSTASVNHRARVGADSAPDEEHQHTSVATSTGQPRAKGDDRSSSSGQLAERTLWKNFLSWVVPASILLLGGWEDYFLSDPPIAARFLSAGIVLLLLRFWTWDEIKRQPARRRVLLRVGAALLSLFLIGAAMLRGRPLGRGKPSTYTPDPSNTRVKRPGTATVPTTGLNAGHKRDSGDNTKRPLVVVPKPSGGVAPASGEDAAGPQAQLTEFTLVLRNDAAIPQFYANDHETLPMSYSSGVARLRLPVGSYVLRIDYPKWECGAYVTLPLEQQRPIPANCRLK